MKGILVASLISVVSALPAGVQTIKSPAGKQYAIVSKENGVSQKKAAAICESLGGKLADLSVGAEFDFLATTKSITDPLWINTWNEKSYGEDTCVAFFSGGAIAVPLGSRQAENDAGTPKLNANGSERLKLVGKHSKDKVLSIYVQKRTILEYEKDGKVEALSGVLRISQAHADRILEKDQVVVIGVLGRLASDFGLQFGEYTVFQQETQIFPRINSETAVTSQGYFDFDNTFINGLPDDYHFQFVLKLPSGMPPSIQLAAPTSCQPETWGLSYYMFAYITSASAVESILAEQQPGHMFWTKLRNGRRHSKAFLAFAKLFIHDHERLTGDPPSAEAIKTSLISQEQVMRATASLDQPAYQYGDAINVSIRITNPKRIKISGIRINVKQLVSIRIGADPKSVVKSCIARYSFGSNREELIAEDGVYHQSHASFRDSELFLDTFKIRPHIDPLRFLYQLALTSSLPRSEQNPPVLAANMNFGGDDWALGGGLERLRSLTVEYYMNIHIVVPWGKNLTLRVPFKYVYIPEFNRLHGLSSLNRIPTTLDSPIFSIPYREKSGDPSSQPRKAIEDIKDLIPVPSNLITLAEGSRSPGSSPTIGDQALSPVSSPSNGSHRRQHSKTPSATFGISTASSLIDDVQQSRGLLRQLRGKLSEEQRIVLKNPLDSRSLQIHFEQRRLDLVKEFLWILDEILNTWIPRFSKEINTLQFMKSTGNLSIFDPIEDEFSSTLAISPIDENGKEHVAARCLVQNFCGRLGMFHSQLSQYQSPKASQEEKMENFNMVIDDVDLMLARLALGLQGKPDDAGCRVSVESVREILARIKQKSSMLVCIIPFYEKFEVELARVESALSLFGWANPKPSSELCMIIEWSPDINSTLGWIAEAFEEVTGILSHNEVSGETLHSSFVKYANGLIKLFGQVPTLSDRVGIAVFWQWNFLLTLLDAYYLDGAESKLMFPRWRNMIWSLKIKSLIPSQWDMVRNSADLTSERLILVGNRVITAMQQLTDSRPS